MSNIENNPTVDNPKAKRAKIVMEMRKHGYSYDYIGKVMSLTKQRIQQIVKAHSSVKS